MKAVVTVIGKDTTGIIAKVSTFLAEHKVNILDISQTIMQEYFTMIMLVDISKSDLELAALSKECERIGDEIELSVRIQHEEIFNAMHNV